MQALYIVFAVTNGLIALCCLRVLAAILRDLDHSPAVELRRVIGLPPVYRPGTWARYLRRQRHLRRLLAGLFVSLALQTIFVCLVVGVL